MSRFPFLVVMRAFLGVACCAVLLLSVGGCDSGSDLPPMAVTKGHITIDGKPLTVGTVSFAPDGKKGNSGTMGMGAIDENGYYEIRTAGHPGALVGWHNITIMAIDEADPEKPWMIPMKYGFADKSGLSREVKADQENVFDLELKSDR